MHIDSNEEILGKPILEVRKFLHHCPNLCINGVTEFWGINEETAQNFVAGLAGLGFVKWIKRDGEEPYLKRLPKGNAFAMASAAKQIKRETADRLVSEFLERVKEVNANPYYLAGIRVVIVFGSYLGDADRLSDIDLMVEYFRKDQSEVGCDIWHDRIWEAQRGGRQFRNVLDEIRWPEREVELFLRKRHHALSFHSVDYKMLIATDHKFIYVAQIEGSRNG